MPWDTASADRIAPPGPPRTDSGTRGFRVRSRTLPCRNAQGVGKSFRSTTKASNRSFRLPRQPTRALAAAQLTALGGAAVVAFAFAGTASWDLALFAALAGCAVAGDLAASATGAAKLKLSGSFLALVLAIVLLGGPPAAAIGAITILVGWLRHREAAHYLLQNLVVYTWFPLLSGLAFHAAVETTGVARTDAAFYVLVFATFVLALALNFILAAGYQCWLERSSLTEKAHAALVPILPSEFRDRAPHRRHRLGLREVGLAALALLAVLFTFQYLLRELLRSQQRAEALEERTPSSRRFSSAR